MFNMEEITDEQVLLAVRSHLVRKHRLPWTEKIRRKQEASLSRRTYLEEEDSPNTASVVSSNTRMGVGYFWDDPSQLKYLGRRSLRKKKRKSAGDGKNTTTTSMNDEDVVDIDDDEAQVYDETLLLDEEEIEPDPAEELEEGSSLRRDASDGDRIGGTSFTSFPSSADEDHVRRSIAAKRTWSNPEFRKKWYAQRWGENYQSTRNRTKLLSKLRSVPADVLRSTQFTSSLTNEEELTNVIRSYISSNRKRSIQRKEMAKNPLEYRTKNYLQDGKERFAYQNSEEGLREAQRKRSEKARAAYQTRLSKEQAKEEVSLVEKDNGVSDVEEKRRQQLYRRQPSQTYVQNYGDGRWLYTHNKRSETIHQQAMNRIIQALHNSTRQPILVDDVQLMLQPQRLSGRKELLIRILKRRFGLFGKCIPKEESEGEDKIKFAMHASVQQLGDYVLILLREPVQED